MRRLATPATLLACFAAACGSGVGLDESPGRPPGSDAVVPDADVDLDAPDGGADRVFGPPIAGAPCERAGAHACTDTSVLFCRDGYGGALWMDRGPCAEGTRCADGFGCAPLPDCGTEGLVACVGPEAFDCALDGAWSWRETCPDEVPCVHGRGCPNVHGIGSACNPDRGPRCADGRIQRCEERGMDFGWSAPVECPDDSACVDGAGCVRPGGCDQRDRATCDGPNVAIYCSEQADGALGWSPPVNCRDGCVEGSGCRLDCRQTRWISGCL